LLAPPVQSQNGYAERLVGTFRRELTDHLIVLNELDGDGPSGRAVEPPENGKVISLPRLCGLHHRYFRRAA
jgi:hypothetical protein